MNNQFSQRVSDIIVYSKEEANRLRSRYIGPEHLLLGMLRDGEGKAIEILSKLNTNLAAIKQQIEAQLKAEADDMLLPDTEVPLSNDAAKILKMCILEARGMKSNIADTEHVLLAILREKNNMAASVLESNNVNYVKVLEQATLQPDINSGMVLLKTMMTKKKCLHHAPVAEVMPKNISNKRKPLQKSRLTIRRYWIISALI